MYIYHLQHLLFYAAEMVGISRDLAYASVVLESSNNVKLPLAWGTVLQSIKPIRCIALSPVVGFETQVTIVHGGCFVETCILLSEVAFCFSPHLTEKDLVTFWCFVIVNLYIIHNISNFIFYLKHFYVGIPSFLSLFWAVKYSGLATKCIVQIGSALDG